MSVRVSVNGEPQQLPAQCSVAQLLERLGLTGRLAVELNAEILPRSAYASRTLQEGDRLEIVQAIGGG